MSKCMALAPAGATESLHASESARLAVKWVWFYFILALIISIALRAERTKAAADDIIQLAQVVDQRLSAARVSAQNEISKLQANIDQLLEFGGEGIASGIAGLNAAIDEQNKSASADKIAELIAKEYLAGDGSEPGAYQLRALGRALAYEISINGMHANATEGDRSLSKYVKKTMFLNLIVISIVHAAILASFPAFFTMTAFGAKRHILQFSPGRDGSNAVDSGKFAETFWNGVWYHRHIKFLKAERKSNFGRRLGFALIASLSLTYMFAPSGLYSTAVGEFVTIAGVPGRSTNPYWFAEFAQASPFVLGLLGFLVFSLLTVVRRGISFDVSSSLFLSLWNRGITVVILSLVLTAIDQDSNTFRAMIFIAGIFPESGLQAIAKLAQSGADKLAEIKPAGLTDLPDIDSIKEGSLRELGIYSVHDLAQTDLSWLMIKSRIQPRVLLKAVDRALLLDRLGKFEDKLAKIPAFTATDLILYVFGTDAYESRWANSGMQPSRRLGVSLEAAEKERRLKVVADTLEVTDVRVHLDGLNKKSSLWFILDNRLAYDDL